MKSNRSLSANYYSSDKIWQKDKQLLKQQWQLAGHKHFLNKTGTYRRIEVLGEDVLLWAQDDQTIKSFANICIHHGSTLCAEQKGEAARLVCPYHSWCFDLSGNLVSTRGRLKEIENKVGLHSFHTKTSYGLHFLMLEPPSDDAHASCQELSKYFDFYGMANSRVIGDKSYQCSANWKLVAENLLECYHCMPNHPQLSAAESHIGILEQKDMDFLVDQQMEYYEIAEKYDHCLPANREGIAMDVDNYALMNACSLDRTKSSGTESGKLVASLMGKQKVDDHGFLYGALGPLIHFAFYSDHIVIFNVQPRSVDNTEIQILWLVDDACDLNGAQVDQITWLWDTTIKQDIDLNQNVQKQMRSDYYKGGYYVDMEQHSEQFKEWYLQRLNAL